MFRSVRYLLFLILLCEIVAYTYCSEPGVLKPQITVARVGESFNITCQLNSPLIQGKSTEYYFVDDETKKKVPSNDLVYPNGNLIVFMVRNATKQSIRYLCQSDKYAIGYAEVYVGTPPLPVKEFECQSYDFANVNCSFFEQDNPVNTKYDLKYYKHSPAYTYNTTCDFQQRPRFKCSMPFTNNELYNFTLRGTNSLGEYIQHFNVNIFDIMELANTIGDNFNVESITWNSIEVSWGMQKWNHFNRRELQWEILLKPENHSTLNLTLSADIWNISNRFRMYLSNLPYAYYKYVLSMRVKLNSSTKWSKPFKFNFQTNGHRPRAPHIKPGSFYIDSSETKLRIYWQELKPPEYGGDNFTYIISKDGDSMKSELKSNSVVIPWEKMAHYRFRIHSRNHLGESIDVSYLEIFPIANRNPLNYKPNNIYAALNESSNTYILTWNMPNVVDRLINYTVFWCSPKRAIQNECIGSIHFAEVSANTTMFSIVSQRNDELILGISANYLDYNMGIQWAFCTGEFNSTLIKMKLELQPNATSMLIKWPTTICPSILMEYQLFYCAVEGELCVNERKLIIDRNLQSYSIQELKPYTKYKVQMLMRSFEKIGTLSDPIYNYTLQSAPSPPRQLQISDITNTTATLSWMPPIQPNGKITEYIVYMGANEFKVPPATDKISGKVIYKLVNLTSYTMFKVYVVARTIEKSNSSNDVHFKTKIGYPSKPDYAEMRIDNGKLHWTKSNYPNGRVDCYEVSITRMVQNDIIDRRISVLCGKMSCEIKIPSCPLEEHRTTIDVRAVNVAHYPDEVTALKEFNATLHEDNMKIYYEGNEDLECVNTTIANTISLRDYFNSSMYQLYKSDWHNISTHLCLKNRYAQILQIMGILAALTFILILFLILRRKWQKMANIRCALPPQLDTFLSTDSGFSSEQNSSEAVTDQQKVIVNNEKCHLLDSFTSDTILNKTNSFMNLNGVENNNSEIDGISVESYNSVDTQNNSYDMCCNSKDCNILTSCNNGGYIPFDSVNINSPKINSNGYISAAQFQSIGGYNDKKQNLLCGYTTMVELKRLNFN